MKKIKKIKQRYEARPLPIITITNPDRAELVHSLFTIANKTREYEKISILLLLLLLDSHSQFN